MERVVAKSIFAGRGLVFIRGLEMFQKTGLDKKELKLRGGHCDPQSNWNSYRKIVSSTTKLSESSTPVMYFFTKMKWMYTVIYRQTCSSRVIGNRDYLFCFKLLCVLLNSVFKMDKPLFTTKADSIDFRHL